MKSPAPLVAATRSHAFAIPLAALSALLLIVATCLNVVAKREAAALPRDYQRPMLTMHYGSETMAPAPVLLAINEERVPSARHIPAMLPRYRSGERAAITERVGDRERARIITFEAAYSGMDIATSLIVAAGFLLFALGVALRYRDRAYRGILLATALGTAAMVTLDWGTHTLYPAAVNFALRLLFDCAIWMVPVLFFHFSCVYPATKNAPKRSVLPAGYAIAAAGIAASIDALVTMTGADGAIPSPLYCLLHGTVNDAFIVTGLLASVINFEHSALHIESVHQRRNISWVLMGIIVGPLVYVFMMLVPRTLMGQEFISDAAMQYALLIAPIGFWIALRRNGGRYAEAFRDRHAPLPHN